MAPNSGPTKHRKAGSSLSGRPVVPAIPLPHVKRQAAAAANRSAKAKANPPATPIAPENVTRKKPEFKASDSLGKTTADSSSVERTSPKPLAEQTASRANQQTTTAQLDSTQVNAEGSKLGTSGPMASETSLLSTKDNTEVSVENNTDLTRLGASPEQTNGLPTMGEFRNGETAVEDSTKVDSVSSSSPNQRPAPVSGPSTRRQSTTESEAPAPANLNGRYRLQQSHLSDNNLHFGALDDSEVSSPGLATSGGFGPPPGFAAPSNQSRVVTHAGNGVSQAALSAQDMMLGASFDNLGRPVMAFTLGDLNYSLPNGLNPSKPQSFHDSQSSVQQDDVAAYQPQLSGAPPNGLSSDGVPPRPFQNHIPRALNHPPPMLHPASPLGLSYHNNQALGLAAFIQQAWLNGQYVDCVLEVRDRRGLVDRFPAHHLILAQSPVLNNLLLEQGLQPLPFSLSPRPPMTIFLNTDNKWFWTESLKLIINSLYGFSYPNPNPQGPLNELDASFLMGHSSRCLGFALSYAAGGHILGLNQVLARGAELATRHLEPRTVDTAMAFALEDYTDKGTHEHFKYGAGSKILLHAIVGFVASNLSQSFHLDVSSTLKGVEYARLPYDSASTSESETIASKGNVVGHLSKGSNVQKQLNIQFGDLSVSAQGQDESGVFTATLSRVLLNLPFSSLKLLAEYGPETTTSVRVQAVQMAVREREARRLRALDAVVSGVTANADMVREMLQSPEPKQYTHWGVLGWREELTHTAEGPSLARQWQPLRLTAKLPVTEYP